MAFRIAIASRLKRASAFSLELNTFSAVCCNKFFWLHNSNMVSSSSNQNGTRQFCSNRDSIQLAEQSLKQQQNRLDDIAYGFMGSQALFAGLELQIFDAISILNSENSSNPCTIENICKQLNMDLESQLHGIEVLLDSLLKLELIDYNYSNKCYKNSVACEKYLVSNSLSYYGDYYKIQISKLMYPRMGLLSEILGYNNNKDNSNNNNNNKENEKNEELHKYTYSKWMENSKNAELYSMSQHNGSLGVGSLIVKNKLINVVNSTDNMPKDITLLDLGGGTGAISIKLCEKYPKIINKSIIIDFNNVIQTAKNNILPNLDSNIVNKLEYIDSNVLEYNNWLKKINANDKINVVLLSYLLVSIPHNCFNDLFENIYNILSKNKMNENEKSQIIIHDFITIDENSENSENNENSSYLTSLWTLQHATVNPGVSLLKYDKIKEMLIDCGFENVKVCPALSRLTMFVTAEC